MNQNVNMDLYRCDKRQEPKEFQPKGQIATELGPSQKRICLLLLEDLSNKEIAEKIHTTEETVKVSMYRLIKKLGVKSRVGVALWAYKNLQEGITNGHTTSQTAQ